VRVVGSRCLRFRTDPIHGISHSSFDTLPKASSGYMMADSWHCLQGVQAWMSILRGDPFAFAGGVVSGCDFWWVGSADSNPCPECPLPSEESPQLDRLLQNSATRFLASWPAKRRRRSCKTLATAAVTPCRLPQQFSGRTIEPGQDGRFG
jgi:hypothetical protein